MKTTNLKTETSCIKNRQNKFVINISLTDPDTSGHGPTKEYYCYRKEIIDQLRYKKCKSNPETSRLLSQKEHAGKAGKLNWYPSYQGASRKKNVRNGLKAL